MAPRWKELGQEVRRQRILAGYNNVDEFGAFAGVHGRTVLTLERGAKVGTHTLVRIEAALGWPPGSSQRVLDGGGPPPLSKPDEVVGVQIAEDIVVRLPVMGRTTEELRRAARAAAEAAGRAVLDSQTDGD